MTIPPASSVSRNRSDPSPAASSLGERSQPASRTRRATSSDEPAKYHRSVKDMKRQMIIQALQQAKGNYLSAAKTLGIHPNSLLRLMRNLNVKSSTKAAQPSSSES